MSKNERVVIKWTKLTREKITGILTLDCWGVAWSTEAPITTYVCECSVTENSVGMGGIGKCGTIPPFSEEQISAINDLMRWYYDGFTGKTTTCHWMLKEGK
jgi:hypothetical protein